MIVVKRPTSQIAFEAKGLTIRGSVLACFVVCAQAHPSPVHRNYFVLAASRHLDLSLFVVATELRSLIAHGLVRVDEVGMLHLTLDAKES